MTDANGVADHVDVWDERAGNILFVLGGLTVGPELGEVVEGVSVRKDVELVGLVTLVEGV